MAKKCNISNFPIDLMTLKPGAYQVACAKTGWYSPIFADIDEAIEFRSAVNPAKLLSEATREDRDGKFRLVNKHIMTRFMNAAEFDALQVKINEALATKVKRANA